MYRISLTSGKEYFNDIEIPRDDTNQLYIDRCDFLRNGGEFEYFEGTSEEILEANKPKVPEIVSRRQFKIALAILGYNENDILSGIDQLPEPNRTIARISYTESGTFERYSSDLIYVSKTFLGLTDEQIDEVFLTAINY